MWTWNGSGTGLLQHGRDGSIVSGNEEVFIRIGANGTPRRHEHINVCMKPLLLITTNLAIAMMQMQNDHYRCEHEDAFNRTSEHTFEQTVDRSRSLSCTLHPISDE